MFKILTLLAILGAQQIFAEKYVPYDNCIHYTGPFYPYQEFTKTKSENGLVTVAFHAITEGEAHFQLSAENKFSSDFIEIVFDELCELRRRGDGTYVTIDSASGSHLLSKFRPFAVRVETKSEGSGRRVKVFVNDKLLLNGVDSRPVTPNYYAFASYQRTSEFFHKCTKPESNCSGLLDGLRAELNRLAGFVTKVLSKAGYTVNQITGIVAGILSGENLIEGVGDTVDSVANLVGGVVDDVGDLLGGLLSFGK